jgi:hypothetical protein
MIHSETPAALSRPRFGAGAGGREQAKKIFLIAFWAQKISPKKNREKQAGAWLFSFFFGTPCSPVSISYILDTGGLSLHSTPS